MKITDIESLPKFVVLVNENSLNRKYGAGLYLYIQK